VHGFGLATFDGRHILQGGFRCMAVNCLGYPVSTPRTRLGFFGFISHCASRILRGIGAQHRLFCLYRDLCKHMCTFPPLNSSHGYGLVCFNACFLARAVFPLALIKVISVALWSCSTPAVFYADDPPLPICRPRCRCQRYAHVAVWRMTMACSDETVPG
jgi:hypothetical protein